MEIKCLLNGPYLITGDDLSNFFKGDEIFELKEGSIALCRCGQSGNKPFCDGTHSKVDFEAEESELVS